MALAGGGDWRRKRRSCQLSAISRQPMPTRTVVGTGAWRVRHPRPVIRPKASRPRTLSKLALPCTLLPCPVNRMPRGSESRATPRRRPGSRSRARAASSSPPSAIVLTASTARLAHIPCGRAAPRHSHPAPCNLHPRVDKRRSVHALDPPISARACLCAPRDRAPSRPSPGAAHRRLRGPATWTATAGAGRGKTPGQAARPSPALAPSRRRTSAFRRGGGRAELRP